MNASSIFRPGKPIDNPHYLVGRTPQLNRVRELLAEGGRTVVITGTRGIGKTSLARISASTFGSHVDTQCNGATTFHDWSVDLLTKLGVPTSIVEKSLEESFNAGFGATLIASLNLGGSKKTAHKEQGIAQKAITPERLLNIARQAKLDATATVDEFDRIPRTKVEEIGLFGDLIKVLGDSSDTHNLRLIFIGVSSGASRLFNGHPSIKRNVTAIHLNRLTRQAIRSFFKTVYDESGVRFEADVVERFATDFMGFPHFVHAVGDRCAKDRKGVSAIDMRAYERAVDAAVDEMLGIDSSLDLITSKKSAETDIVLIQILEAPDLRVTAQALKQKLAIARYDAERVEAAIEQLIERDVIRWGYGKTLVLADPEISPFLQANFRRRRHVTADVNFPLFDSSDDA
ncbi:ATP-binding protein [Polaromonas sp.]|uniref:ATP-binding protein n=1 Tax=Polaromonas sp. TaxID=1869339 RepID=UPI002731E8DE|nr:ATP-binding protein [Polaromonas sp.]MDP1740128.1 ATP-binding protein [Polaromonas sp.]